MSFHCISTIAVIQNKKRPSCDDHFLLVEATSSKWNSILSELIAMNKIVEFFREEEFAGIKR